MRPAQQVAFLTGQSDPATCDLSPPQLRALGAVCDGLAVVPVRRNFPWRDDLRGWHPVPVGLASARHALLFARSRTAAWARDHRGAALDLVARADRTVLLAGSIGLDLLRLLDLPGEVLARVDVFSYGATTRWRPPGRHLRVRGRRDRIARAVPWETTVDCGHMDYLASTAVVALARSFVADAPGGGRPGEWDGT